MSGREGDDVAEREPWNILVIVCDTLRRDYLGAYGNPWISTPALNRLAAEAQVFEEHWVGSFPTIPLRQDLLTGRYVFPFWGWAPLPAGRRETLATALQRAGFVTQLITDNPHYLKPGMNLHFGFRGWDVIRGQVSDAYATAPADVDLPCAAEKLRSPDEVRNYLRNVADRKTEADYFPARVFGRAAAWLEANRGRRFFLLVDSFDVHEPWDPPQWYVDRYDPGYEGQVVIQPRYLDRLDYISEAELRHVRALYAAEVTMVDRWLGRFLEHVQDLGLWEHTAIVFISDHGYYLGEHEYTGKHTVDVPQRGWPLYAEVARVPLFIRVPGLAPGRSAALAQAVDVHATLRELVGVPHGPEAAPPHGVSLLPVLRGDAAAARDLAISSPTLPTGPDRLQWSSVTDGDWLLLDPGGFRSEGVEPRIYARAADPGSVRNLWATPEGRQRAEALHRRYMARLGECGVAQDVLRLRAWPGEAQ